MPAADPPRPELTAPPPGPLVVTGECVADIVRVPGEADQIHPGGSPANVAYGLARLGWPVEFVTELGADAHGDLMRGHLAGAGVRVRATDTVRTPSAVVTLDEAGHAAYDFAIDWRLPSLPALDPPPRHVHTGSIAAVADPGARTVWRAVAAARETATVSYDPNVRPALMGDRETAVARVAHGVARSDVVKASDEDLAWLYPGWSVVRVAAEWLASGPALVLVTRGGDGALAFTDGRRRAVPARDVTVVDTVGAGDAFMAGALHALAELDALGAARRSRLAALDATEVDEVLCCAAEAAALTVAVAGAAPPDAAALAAARRAV